MFTTTIKKETQRGIVVIPTYNEVDNIELILSKVFGLNMGLDIVVVDDNSPDKTYKKVEELMRTTYTEHLHLIVREKKAGLGKAYIAGFKWALAHKKHYSFIIEMDADLSHNPKYLPKIIQKLEDYDLVIGSRYIKGGGCAPKRPFFREAISHWGSFCSRMLFDMQIMDITGGFKCFRREVLEAIDLDNIFASGYSFQIEMNCKAESLNFKILEIPITFEERASGRSKMTQKVFIEAFIQVVKLFFHTRLGIKN